MSSTLEHVDKARVGELSEVLERARDFVETELYPLEPTFLQEGFGAVLPRLREKREKVRAMGLFTPQMPAEAGGLGLSLPDFGRLSEVLGRSPLGHYAFNCQAPDAGNMEILHQYGTPAQQEKFLEPLIAGSVRSAFAMTEPKHAGSNPVWMSTTAEKDGDDYVINGHKWFTTGFDGSSFVIVMAVTNPDAEKPHERASMLITPSDAPGLVHVRRIKIVGEEGEDHHSHSELRFENLRVPAENLLGEENAGFAIAQQRLGPGRIHHCMRWIGICERAFDLMCARAAGRELSPGKPLATKQSVQNWIAESRADINAARLLVLDAAERIEREGSRAARTEVSVIKFFVADVLMKVIDRAIQTHGALGVTDDTPLSFWYRHERGARIYDGADEVHKGVVARRVMRGYGVKL